MAKDSIPAVKQFKLSTSICIELQLNSRVKCGVMDFISNYRLLHNPPWVRAYKRALSPALRPSMADLLRAELARVLKRSRSAEFNKQILLASHDLSHAWLQTGLTYSVNNLHGKLIAFRLLSESDRVKEFDSKFSVRLTEDGIEYVDILFLQLFSFFLDKALDYWNGIADSRSKWLATATAFRELLGRKLKFKPFHTPLRLFPSSIHPIESAA